MKNTTDNNILLNEVPFGQLSKFGIGPTEFDALPDKLKADILNGQLSPVMVMTYVNAAGAEYKFKCQFRLIKNDNGIVEPRFAPAFAQAELEDYDVMQRRRFSKGLVVWYKGIKEDKLPYSEFHQYDPETKNVLVASAKSFGKTFQALQDRFNLSTSDLNIIRGGDPHFILLEDGGAITVGIDLKEPNGIRICQGTPIEWAKAQTHHEPQYVFGEDGCWITASDGSMEYVNERDYTEEILVVQQQQLDTTTKIK